MSLTKKYYLSIKADDRILNNKIAIFASVGTSINHTFLAKIFNLKKATYKLVVKY